jgi:Zn-dependent metalloprotease
MKARNRMLSVLVCLIMVLAAFTMAVPEEGGVNPPTVTTEIDSEGPTLNLVATDQEPPEAVIRFDADTKETVIYGIDNVDDDVEIVETIVEEKPHEKTSLYTLADDAGNTLDLLLEQKSSDGNIGVRVLEMSYNGGQPIVPGENHFKVEFKIEKKTSELTHLHQNIHVIDEFKINTDYKSEEETSINYREEESCKAKFEVDGLVLIDLMTDDGQLIISHLTDEFADYYDIDELMDFYDYVEECQSADVVQVEPPQLISYVHLVNASAVPMEIRFGDVFGVPEFLAGRWATDPTITNPEDKAIDFVETYGDVFRLNSTTDSFTVYSVKTGSLYITNVRLQQTYFGIPVYGAEELVHLDQNNDVLFMHGTFVPEISVSTTPQIPVTEAFDIAHEDLKGTFPNVQNVSILQYELCVYNPAVVNEFATDTNFLVWLLIIGTDYPDGLWYYFVDAQSGEIIKSQDAIRRAYSSEVYDARDGSGADPWFRDGVQVRVGVPPTDASEMNDYLGIYYDYLRAQFGHDSIDDAGETLVAITYYRGDTAYNPWTNRAQFEESWVTRDSVAHEYSHGLVEESGGSLTYERQSGALDEHLADSFAEFSDCHRGCNWLVGLDAEGDLVVDGTQRSMEDPPVKNFVGIPHPDHMDDFLAYDDEPCTTGLRGNDLCAVHANAGIPNKVVYLITEGGVHYGVSVSRLGLHKAERLVFSTIIDIGLTRSANFRQYKDVMLQTCRAMIGGAAGITASDCKEVSDAWCSVGLCFLTQNVAGRRNEDFDRFGYSLAAGDFNGDDRDDLAVGVPFENHRRKTNNGAVIVFYGSAIGLSAIGAELITQSLAGIEEDDHDKFGISLAVGNFDGDDYDDLVVGAPSKDIGREDTGQVVVFYGGSYGLIVDICVIGCDPVKSEVLDQEDAGERNERDDKFGYSLATGDFDGDGYDDLAVGVPYEDVRKGPIDAGMVVVCYGRFDGLIKDIYLGGTPPVNSEVLDQRDAGERNWRYDRFGRSLAAGNFNGDDYDDLAVGVPSKNIEDAIDTGMVDVFYGDEDGFIVLGSATVELLDQSIVGEENEYGDRFGFSLAVGDFDGDSYYDLAIGTAGEDIVLGMIVLRNAGMVAVVYGASYGLTKEGDVRSRYEILDDEVYTVYNQGRFGYKLAAGKVDNNRYYDLVVGMPWRDIYHPEDVENTGLVAVFYGSRDEGLVEDGSASFQNLRQETLGGTSRDDDHFGFAIAAGDFDGLLKDELAIGVPWEDLGGDRDVGAVYLWEG